MLLGLGLISIYAFGASAPAKALETLACEDFVFPAAKPSRTVHGDDYFSEVFFEDCMAYVGNGGRDAVIVPDGFGGVAADAYKPAIEALLDAAADARAVYDRYGPAPPRNLMFLTERSRPHVAAYVTTKQDPADGRLVCWALFSQSEWSAMTAASAAWLKHVASHEFAHCLVDAYAGIGEADHWADDSWWSEGTAEYFAAQVYPAANEEFERSADYSSSTPMTDQAYSMVLFWQHYANTHGGPASVLAFAKEAYEWGWDNEENLALRPGFPETLHDFAEIALLDGVSDPGGGTMAGPLLDESTNLSVSGEAGATRLSISLKPLTLKYVVIAFSGGFDYRLEPPVSADGEIIASYGRELSLGSVAGWTRLEESVELEGECDAPTQYVFLLTSTADVDELDVTMEIEPIGREEACRDCPTRERDVDECLYGDWTLDELGWRDVIAQIKAQIAAETGPLPPHTIDLETVDNLTAICPTNKFEGYDDLKLAFAGEQTLPEMGTTISVAGKIDRLASAFGKVCVNKGAGTLRFVSQSHNHTDRGSAMVMEAGGIRMPAPLGTTRVSPLGLGAGETMSYRCRGDRLELTADAEWDAPSAPGAPETRTTSLSFVLKRTDHGPSFDAAKRQGVCLMPE